MPGGCVVKGCDFYYSLTKLLSLILSDNGELANQQWMEALYVNIAVNSYIFSTEWHSAHLVSS